MQSNRLSFLKHGLPSTFFGALAILLTDYKLIAAGISPTLISNSRLIINHKLSVQYQSHINVWGHAVTFFHHHMGVLDDCLYAA